MAPARDDIHEHDIAHIEVHGFFVDIAPAHSSAAA
jgi:hypothetical protein